LLADLDVELVRAKSGLEAIEKTRQHEFALILMDVQMPGMDGFETVEIIRQDEKTFYCRLYILPPFTMEIITGPRGSRQGQWILSPNLSFPTCLSGKSHCCKPLQTEKIT